MKNRLDASLPPGLKEMNDAELREVSGGFARLFLALPAAFKAVYELGKAAGREMYYLHNN